MHSNQQSQNIDVFLRCRPSQSQKKSVLTIDSQQNEAKIILDNKCVRSFFYNKVFGPDSTQEEVYDAVVSPLIEQIVSGFNCTVFAYGPTGSGKTFTMEGDMPSDADDSFSDTGSQYDNNLGIIPRAVNQLFDELFVEEEFLIKVSFLELYNEETYDLLSSLEDTTKLRIYEDANRKGSVIVGGLNEVAVRTKEEIYEILRRGSAKRQKAATLLNANSSRSHTVFSITVRIKNIEGKLNLVDLAGFENIGRSGAQDKRAREAGSINQSLLTLNRVMTALVENRPHVPYRESKLTRLLQDSLGGRTKTSIIATVSPDPENLDITMSTMDYVFKAKKITNRPEINQTFNQDLSQRDSELKNIDELKEKHILEKNEIEFKVRNEVAVEFRREVEKIRQSYEQFQQDIKKEIEEKNSIIDTLKSDNLDLQNKLENLNEDHAASVKDITSREIDYLKEIEELKNLIEQSNHSRLECMENFSTKEKEYLNEILELKKALEKSAVDHADCTKDFTSRENEHLSKIKELEGSIEELRNNHAELAENFSTKETGYLNEIENLKKSIDKLKDYHATYIENFTTRENKYLSEIEELKKSVEKLKQQGPNKTTASKRARSKVLEESNNDYANMTFDCSEDEIVHFSAKKPRKRNNPVTKAMHETVMGSGKKEVIKRSDAITELSPIDEPQMKRVTRSRTTRSQAARKRLVFDQ